MKTRTLILTGVVSFLLTSLTQLPAALLTERLPANLPLKLQGVAGSPWQGSASSLRWQNLQLQDVQWDWQFASLFKGELSAHLQGRWQGGKLDGICSVGFSGNLQCHDMNLTDLPAQALTPYLQRFMVPPLRGQLQATLDTIVWDRQNLPQTSGRLEWQGAGIQMNPQSFGQYSAILTVDADKNQQISLTSAPDAAFGVDGQITLQANRQFQRDINIKPSKNVDAGVKQFLGMIGGVPQADGSYRLQQQGAL